VPAKGGSLVPPLITQMPRPLPDDDQDLAARGAERQAEPAPVQPQAVRPRRTAAAPVAKPRAATTVRLRPSAAEPLNEAWLAERQASDPKLSYPEFASRIVQLGLAAYAKQQRRSA
jgi:hypothetical protein